MQFIARLSTGDVLTESFQIIEGTTQQQVSEHLAHAPYLNYTHQDWLKIAPSIAQSEGLLMADTYHYDAGSDASDLLIRAHASLQLYLNQSWQNRVPDLPYKTPYEMLIAASIIEKETAIPRELGLISGIIVNRLRKHMPLQMDPTVIYALSDRYTGKLIHDDLKVESPYNTYLYRGLPPTPIAMVGKRSIDAAAHPLSTDYLYFVAKGDGTHEFSTTYEQQKLAIDHYRKVHR